MRSLSRLRKKRFCSREVQLGLKPSVERESLAARLKPCPYYKATPGEEFFRSLPGEEAQRIHAATTLIVDCSAVYINVLTGYESAIIGGKKQYGSFQVLRHHGALNHACFHVNVVGVLQGRRIVGNF